MKKIVFAFALMFGSVASIASDLPKDFDASVEKDMQTWNAPGLGLAIVKDGKTILTKGYGVKSVTTGEKVDEDTVFQAGSTTKAFASMSIAMLIDDGKLNWDDPVIQHLPEFRMKNEYVQNHLTIRDTLRHTSGVSMFSNINMFLGESLADAVIMMADNEQQQSFRHEWDYNNTTFGLSGMVVERVSGMPFHEFVQKRILDPLGMDSTLMLDADVKVAKNRAEAHQFHDGVQYEIIYPYIEYSQSAGMMNSTPVDMSKWMEFLTSGGLWQGKRLVSAELIREMMAPQVLLKPSAIYPAAASYNHDYFAYGLAWFAYNYKGHKVAMHTGSIHGMSAIIAIVPELKAGVYVFINSDHIEYRHALMYRVLDILLGNEEEDWSAKLYPIFHPQEVSGQVVADKEHPAVSAEQLIGTYRLDGLYPVIIAMEKEELVASIGVGKTILVRQKDNSYALHDPKNPDLPSRSNLGISLGDDGAVTAVSFSGLKFTKQ